MNVIKVKPQVGLIVRDPISKSAVPGEGITIDIDGMNGSYWKRRIDDGSLIIVVDEIKIFEDEIITKKKGGDK